MNQMWWKATVKSQSSTCWTTQSELCRFARLPKACFLVVYTIVTHKVNHNHRNVNHTRDECSGDLMCHVFLQPLWKICLDCNKQSFQQRDFEALRSSTSGQSTGRTTSDKQSMLCRELKVHNNKRGWAGNVSLKDKKVTKGQKAYMMLLWEATSHLPL